MDQAIGRNLSDESGTVQRLVRLLRDAAARIRELEAEKSAPREPAVPVPEAVRRLMDLMFADARRIERLEQDKLDLALALSAAERTVRDLHGALECANRSAAAFRAQVLQEGQRAGQAEARTRLAEQRLGQVESAENWGRLFDSGAAKHAGCLAA